MADGGGSNAGGWRAVCGLAGSVFAISFGILFGHTQIQLHHLLPVAAGLGFFIITCIFFAITASDISMRHIGIGFLLANSDIPRCKIDLDAVTVFPLGSNPCHHIRKRGSFP